MPCPAATGGAGGRPRAIGLALARGAGHERRVTPSSSARDAKNRLLDDQARLRLQAMRARLAEASGEFEQRFRSVLARKVQEVAREDPRFAGLAATLRGAAGPNAKG